MRTGVTRRQADLLAFIKAHTEKHGISPSYDEMAVGIGTASKSTVFRLIEGLEERGFIKRFPNRARAIEIVEREPTLPSDLESRVRDYCRAVQIDRPTFDQRAAEELLRRWA